MRANKASFWVPGIVVIALGCSGAPEPQLPFLADLYHPTASEGNPEEVEAALAIERDGDMRRQMITAPNGRRYAIRWRKRSASVGKPQAGRLLNPSKLPRKGAGFVHNGKHPYGTDESVAYLQFAAFAVAAMYPGTAPVLIQDLSDQDGGRLPPHRSHRSGRDADVGLYKAGNVRMKWLLDLPPEELDLEKTWAFVEALLRTGAVQNIFLDRTIQKALYDHALANGWTPRALAGVFEHPAANRRALIRHIRGHRNHLHVRVRCPPEDEKCEP